MDFRPVRNQADFQVITGPAFAYNWPNCKPWEGRISRVPGRDKAPYLSIVIPAYNEARRLPVTLNRLHQYLCAQSYLWEIIVVANGCTDDTEDVVRRAALAIPDLRLLSLRERGKGIASKHGALASQGDIIFLCDADLSMPPDNLARFLALAGTVDVIVGSREAPGAHRYHEPWHRHLMGRVFNGLVQWLAVPGIEDTQCGFKAFRRRAAYRLFPHQTLSGFGFDVELLYLARKLGYSVQELPIEWYFDADTRVRPGVDSLAMLGEVFMVRLRDVLGRYGAPLPTPSEEGDPVR